MPDDDRLLRRDAVMHRLTLERIARSSGNPPTMTFPSPARPAVARRASQPDPDEVQAESPAR